jgi:hypothetical protein
MATASFELIRFVAGPYDGRAMPVPRPILGDAELWVLPRDPSGCSAFYSLGDDGRFHYLPSGRGDRSRARGSAALGDPPQARATRRAAL